MRTFAAILVATVMVAAVAGVYTVNVERLLTAPILSEAFSTFEYNYNSAYVPGVMGGAVDCLAVRVQNVAPGANSPFIVGPSSITIVCSSSTSFPFGPVTQSSVVIRPTDSIFQHIGVEDPRVVLVPQLNTLLMFYTAVNNITNAINPNGNVRAMLALASCNLNLNPNCSSWTLHGPILPTVFWSKSGALLLNASGPEAYLFWGDSSICIATTTDLMTYTPTSTCIITPRPGQFDSTLVESGPPPVKLSDGNYLFLYNSARIANIPNPKPGWNLQYNLGYVVLAGNNPATVLQRSSSPILSPTLPWERCANGDNVPGLTPNVVFVEGMRPLANGTDTWIVYYQGCDSRMGMALLTVTSS